MTEGNGWQFALDIHPAGWRFPAGKSWVAGWIRPAGGPVITDLRARLHHRVILGLSLLPHPFFNEKAPGPGDSPRSGFSFLLAPQPGATVLRLEARDLAGQWTEFFRTTISTAPDASAPAPAPSLSPSLGPLAAALLRRRLRAPGRTWTDLADDIMASFVAEPLNAEPNSPFVGALEEPGETGRLRYGRIPVTGWLAHTGARIVRVTAVIDPLPATTLPHGLSRQDIDAVFPALGGQADSAFVGEVALPSDLATPVLLKIFAELDNGKAHLVFGRRFTPRFHGGTLDMPPLVSGFTFARAIWALRGSAGRFAVSRHGLIRAARDVWAGYTAVPAYRPKETFRPESGPPGHESAGSRPTAVADGPPASTVIAPADDMCVPDASQYFNLGREALALVQDAVARAGGGSIRAILDLPCGYGRVARWLRTAYPDARLTVSDIQEPAVAFCVEQLGATGVHAGVDGRHWGAMPGPYDLIWCGSLLTHLDRDQWVTHLRRFAERLAPHGVLVFTSHGLLALDWLQSGEKDYGLPETAVARLRTAALADGFGYVDYPDTPGYGISVAQPGWILELVARETDLHVLDLRVAGWDRHQDVVICTRRPPGKRTRFAS